MADILLYSARLNVFLFKTENKVRVSALSTSMKVEIKTGGLVEILYKK